MALFYYKRMLTLDPRPGMKSGTTYIKQSQEEYLRLRNWIAHIAEDIVGIIEIDPDLADWFTRPQADFRKKARGEYYSPEEIITDILHQMSLSRDVPEAMIGRWNRLCAGTPWQIDLEPMSPAKH
jgi:hypothetical protein